MRRNAQPGIVSPRASCVVEREVAVLVVADDGVPGLLQVHADLMGATRS
jgi:hypothetical protein